MKHKEIKILFDVIMNEFGNPPIKLLSTKEWFDKFGEKENALGCSQEIWKKEHFGDIWINPRGDRIPETIRHEMIHLLFPYASEDWITSCAKLLTEPKQEPMLVWFVMMTINDMSENVKDKLSKL